MVAVPDFTVQRFNIGLMGIDGLLNGLHAAQNKLGIHDRFLSIVLFG